MDVGITGSHGLIGTALAQALRIEGHRVVPIIRGAPAAGQRAVQWDPDAGTIDADGLRGLDGVVHLAGEGIGEHRWSTEQKRKILESRTNGTRLLAETLAQIDERPPVLVSASGINYYGDRGDEVLTEESGPGDQWLSDVCVRWEAATSAAAEAGVRVACMRSGIVLSADGGALKRQLPLFKAFLGGRLGTGKQYQSWMSIDDEIGGIRWLLEHDVAGPVNFTAPAPVTNAAFTATLAKVLGRPAFLPIPAFGPRLVLGQQLADELLFASMRVVPAVLERTGYRFRHRDLETALRAVLGRPTELA